MLEKIINEHVKIYNKPIPVRRSLEEAAQKSKPPAPPSS